MIILLVIIIFLKSQFSDYFLKTESLGYSLISESKTLTEIFNDKTAGVHYWAVKYLLPLPASFRTFYAACNLKLIFWNGNARKDLNDRNAICYQLLLPVLI